MADCFDPKEGLVHKSHSATGRTFEQDEGNSVVTYRVWRCQCGGHTLDVFESAKEKPAK